ncbi:hypothetical protein ACMD2_15356 [Ananas comosus]|uniref:UspA domain-containing protein n=1 Tax=Ananas comosus TaxID=4615 RepID=A0A199VIB9_ANACO|nr:hypothetical protein ACMD2_15356 [Ananas comosus]
MVLVPVVVRCGFKAMSRRISSGPRTRSLSVPWICAPIETFVSICIVIEPFSFAVTVRTEVMIGDPKVMICKATVTLYADLLVIGRHSIRPISWMFLGSVSKYCVNHPSLEITQILGIHRKKTEEIVEYAEIENCFVESECVVGFM